MPLVSNSLVIVSHPSTDWELASIDQLNDLPFRYLLVGDPKFVPAGKYAKQFLQSSIDPETDLSLWDSVDGRVCPTSDLRRVLALVEADRSLIGMVYATDIVGSHAVRVLHQVPQSAASVDYYSVLLSSSGQTQQRSKNTNRFLNDLFSDSSSKIFDRFGFRVPPK